MKVNIRIRDASDEYTFSSFQIADIDGVTRTWVEADGDADTLVGHIQAHTIGTVASAGVSQATQADDETRPSDNFAQRELGLRFYLRDQTTQELGYFTLGTADLDIGSVVAGKDELDLSASPTAAFVTWLEANVLSRDGNAVVVEKAMIVGRNS